MNTELHQVFSFLARNGMNPTWVAGQVVANVPGLTVWGGGSKVHHTQEVVRTMRQAVRLVNACN